ncbi:helix-turn-helix domain-containing protein [Litchfieldia salsa]|uniref:AraC-type DNA-binding protein n=1 Tax=Litchfieldia salsa TaxID=930152 RepID=A0A1H0VMP4_9BACI|nr:helix-turn-helix domain-containing protein [Litchfieldia salsa]SDP79777.1 AraC-type DNA-binding protein [Litchfieldia salsa]
MKHAVLHKIYEAIKLPLQIFDGPKHIHSYGSDGFQPNPSHRIMDNALNTSHSVCYVVSSENSYCGLVRFHNSSMYVIVGPATSREYTRKQAQSILANLQQPAKRTDELLLWLNTIPRCEIKQFKGILCLLDYLLNGVTEHDVVQIESQIKPSIMKSITVEPGFIDHFNDFIEKQILSNIEYGNLIALEDVLKFFNSDSGEVPLIASDAVRSLKNIFIFATGLASRAAVKGGLDYDTAMTVSTHYLTQIEKFDHTSEITNFLKQMFIDYTQRTARSRTLLSDSLLVNKIYKYVQAHLYEKITGKSISNHLNMNYSYICRHFKQETGKTVTEFINEMKIKESIRLLEITEMPIIQISTQLGFSSQNYFHTVFKKVTGLTPIEYRNKLKIPNHND